MNATERIARFITKTRYDDIPRPVLDATRTIILDGVANVLAGSTQPALEYPGIPTSSVNTWVQARAGLNDGRVLVERCDAYRGAARNPIGRDAHLVKVRDCMRRALPEPATERLIGLVEGLEDLKDTRVLARALVGE